LSYVGACLDAVLSGERVTGRWNPRTRIWQ
jgi:hypothetical protein